MEHLFYGKFTEINGWEGEIWVRWFLHTPPQAGAILTACQTHGWDGDTRYYLEPADSDEGEPPVTEEEIKSIISDHKKYGRETTYYENFALSELSDKAKKLMEEGALTPEHLYKLGLFKE